MVDKLLPVPKGVHVRKQIKLLPWITLNISKTGTSLSLGPDSMHITTGAHGTWVYANLPGAGIYYRRKLDKLMQEVQEAAGDESAAQDGTAKGSPAAAARQAPVPPVVTVNLVQRITAPNDELQFVAALNDLNAGDESAAYDHARQARTLPDGAFLAGVLALKHEDARSAVLFLKDALDMRPGLGEAARTAGIDLTVALPITGDIAAQVRPDERGVLIALAEAYQHADMPEMAIEALQQQVKREPGELITRLSLAELYDSEYPDAQQMNQRIVELAEGVGNISPLHASLMLYRARALRRLGLLTGALDTLTKALRRKKDYPDELLRALRYERGRVYEDQGKDKQARKEYETVFAEEPGFADVAARLGL